MAHSGYVPIDEPLAGPLTQAATSPFWPFLALMLGGGWLGWPWFALNAFATGSATRWRELALTVVGAIGGGLIFLGIDAVLGAGSTRRDVQYAVLVHNTWQLGIGYVLYLWQARTFSLFETYVGEPRSGLIPLLIGLFALRDPVLAALKGSMFLVGVGS